MKLYTTLLFSLVAVLSNAQVGIATQTFSTPSVSMEFPYEPGNPDKARGIVLPWVTSSQTMPNTIAGTLIFDLADKKVKYRKNSSIIPWGDLTFDTTGQADTTSYTTIQENTSAKVVIGSVTALAEETPNAILILSDINKGMILPKVDNYKNLPNPTAGLIVYDVTNQLLCTYNGTVWTFLKAED